MLGKPVDFLFSEQRAEKLRASSGGGNNLRFGAVRAATHLQAQCLFGNPNKSESLTGRRLRRLRIALSLKQGVGSECPTLET